MGRCRDLSTAPPCRSERRVRLAVLICLSISSGCPSSSEQEDPSGYKNDSQLYDL
ncbi:hypothetical protein BDW22DRAFT_1357901 [Trametopsis cervina]|nr:hypothetical protein BDW22DRAFT_1357901 [Trametopsis cervina]